MANIEVDTWLYGEMAKYASTTSHSGYANPQVSLPEGSTISDLLAYLQAPSEERGITFINGQLSAMPGIQPDLHHVLHNGDRVAFFHLNSMWPFQYRFGIDMASELASAMEDRKDHGVRHSYGDE